MVPGAVPVIPCRERICSPGRRGRMEHGAWRWSAELVARSWEGVVWRATFASKDDAQSPNAMPIPQSWTTDKAREIGPQRRTRAGQLRWPTAWNTGAVRASQGQCHPAWHRLLRGSPLAQRRVIRSSLPLDASPGRVEATRFFGLNKRLSSGVLVLMYEPTLELVAT